MSEMIAGPREITVDAVTGGDVEALLGLIDALADFERLPRPDAGARGRLAADVVAEPPRFSALIARVDGEPAAYAIYFETYSTFLARPTLYLEDIFVVEAARRLGVGRALMRSLAREAIRRGCGRMEWQVLDWNANAQRFYESLGATRLGQWWPYRVTNDDIARIAEG